MFTGVLIKESLEDASVIDQVTVTATEIYYPENVAEDQAKIWTLVTFTGEDRQAASWADRLAESLKDGKWYTNFTTTDDEVYVVFSGKIFTYRKGDTKKRAEAEAYAASINIPTDQLDWQE